MDGSFHGYWKKKEILHSMFWESITITKPHIVHLLLAAGVDVNCYNAKEKYDAIPAIR